MNLEIRFSGPPGFTPVTLPYTTSAVPIEIYRAITIFFVTVCPPA